MVRFPSHDYGVSSAGQWSGIPVLVVLSVFASGCGTSGSSGRARPSLSDAVEEAQKPANEQQVIRPQKKKTKPHTSSQEEGSESSGDGEEIVVIAAQLTPPAAAFADSAASPDSAAALEVVSVSDAVPVSEVQPIPESEPPPSTDEGLRFGGFAGGGTFTKGAWSRYRSFGIFAGLQREGASAVVRGAAYVPRIDDASEVGSALKDEWGMYIEGFVVANLMPEHTAMDLGLAGLIRLGFLDWNYVNPIAVDEGNGAREYDGDTLGFLSCMFGVDFTPLRSKHFSVGAALLGGGQLYSNETLNGFRNDVFDSSWMFELSLSLSYRRVGDPLE